MARTLAALPAPRRPTLGAGLFRRGRWFAGQTFSFETVFFLFLYSNAFEVLIKLPIDSTVLFCAMSIPIGLVVVLREGLWLRALPVLTTWVLFVAWVAATFIWTPSKVEATHTLAYLATFTTWCVAVAVLIVARSRERLTRLAVLHVLLTVFLSAVGLYFYFRYGSLRRIEGFEEAGRIYLNWGYAACTGGAVAFAIGLYARLGSLRQGVGFLVFAVCAYFLLVAGGRGPLLAMALACLLPLAAGPPLTERRHIGVSRAQILSVLGILAAGAYIGWLLASGQLTDTLSRFFTLFSQVEDASAIQHANRLLYYPAAWRYFTQAPLLGNGIGSFSIMFYHMEVNGGHPHNLFLQILCELGVVGMALFLLFSWMTLRGLRLARLRRDPLLLVVAMMGFTAFFAAMVAIDIAGNRRLFFFMALLITPALDAARRRGDGRAS